MSNVITKDARNIQNRFLRVYHELRKAKTDYVVNYGSGGSAKSYSQAQFFVKKVFEKKRKLVVLRKVGSDIAESVYSQFYDDALPFWGMVDGVDFYTSKPEGKYKIDIPTNGSKILFRGVENAERFKSINGVTDLWIEEASEFTEEEFSIISDRIRGDGVRIYLTFNPISEDHWLKSRFFDTENKDINGNNRVTIIRSTYKENPFVGNKFIEDMRWYEKYDPEHYAIYGLGEWGIIKSKRPFITALDYNKMFVNLSDEKYSKFKYSKALPVYISLDFNEKWTATVKQIHGKKKVYYESLHESPDDIIRKLAMRYGSFETIITGDSSGRNNNQYTSDESKKTAWLYFKSEYNKYCCGLYNRSLQMQQNAYFNDSFVPTKNIDHSPSRTICNALIQMWGENDNILFDDKGCKRLKDDFKRIDATVQGSLNKTDLNKKDIGHWLDTFRYDVCYFHFREFRELGMYEEITDKYKRLDK